MDENPCTAFFCALRQAAADRAIPSPDPGRRLSDFGCEKMPRIEKAAGRGILDSFPGGAVLPVFGSAG